MSLDEARRFMMERANLTGPTARAEVARYAAWPTQASSYLVGCLAILDIRTRYLARTAGGTATLRDFHDRLAGSGGLPPALAERALATDRSPPADARPCTLASGAADDGAEGLT
jgi:uncharacterized protein (DUF885 family)